MEDSDSNPWLVSNLDEFLFFCCPECDNKSRTKSAFISHALVDHPKARCALKEANNDKTETQEDVIMNEPPSIINNVSKTPEPTAQWAKCHFLTHT